MFKEELHLSLVQELIIFWKRIKIAGSNSTQYLHTTLRTVATVYIVKILFIYFIFLFHSLRTSSVV
jgi:hypothetical protein